MSTYLCTDDDDSFNFGVNLTDMSVKIIDGKTKLKSDECINPFFVGLDGGSVSKLSDGELYKTYKRAFVICMKDEFRLSDKLYDIYKYTTTMATLKTISGMFALIETSMNILRNFSYKNTANIVNREYLKAMFGEHHFENTEIIIPMFELTETTAKINVSLYDKQFGIENIQSILSLTSFYNKSYKRPVIEQLSNHLSELRETQFWCNPKNCNINMSEVFLSRGFEYRGSNSKFQTCVDKKIKINGKNEDIEKVIDVLAGKPTKDTDYLNFIDRKGVYTDIYDALSSSGKRTYYATVDPSELKVKTEDITELICSIDDEEELYYAFNSLVVSKEYCHMVVNNQKVLEKMAPLFKKYAPVYKYLFGYAWLCFYVEECIFKTKSMKGSRFVFDIDTASKLPTFPTIFEDLTQNPYLTILVNHKLMDPVNNCVSLPQIDGHDGYGVCNLEEFKWRFNLFTAGDTNKDLFKGIDWKYFAVSGSVITACLHKNPPLLSVVSNSGQKKEDKWLSYFNHYYGDSDIDLMCNDLSIFGFTDKVNDVIARIKANIGGTDDDIEVEPIKTMAVVVTKEFFVEKGDHVRAHFYNQWTADQMVQNISSSEMKEYLYLTYIENKAKHNNWIRRNKKDTHPFIKNYMELSSIKDMNVHLASYEQTKIDHNILDSDMCFYINDFRTDDKKVPDDKNFMVMKIGENIKFKIKSKKMLKPIELFRSKTVDFFGVVARFHLPCVRAYYQGDNVYMLPSCITAMMTGINIDYKYFAGVRDPIDIINKYRMRGYGVLLTDTEKKHMAYYNNHIKTFGGMFYVGGSPDQINKMFGAKDLNDKLFHPLVYTQGLPEDAYAKVDVRYLKTMDDLKRVYRVGFGYEPSNFGFDLFKLRTIDEEGYVMPYHSWVPKAYYDTIKANTTERKQYAVLLPQDSSAKSF